MILGLLLLTLNWNAAFGEVKGPQYHLVRPSVPIVGPNKFRLTDALMMLAEVSVIVVSCWLEMTMYVLG